MKHYKNRGSIQKYRSKTAKPITICENLSAQIQIVNKKKAHKLEVNSVPTANTTIAAMSDDPAAAPEKRREPTRDKITPTAKTMGGTRAASDPRLRNVPSETEKKPEPVIEPPKDATAAGKAEAKPESLTDDEINELKTCEAVIEQGIHAFTAVGRALATINGKRLYRMTHALFEEYCEEVWKMERAHAYRLINAAGVVDDIERQVKALLQQEGPGCLQIGDIRRLTSESVVRPLTKLKTPQKRYEVFQKAIELAGNEPLTAAKVQEVVEGHKPKAAETEETDSGATSSAPQGNEKLKKVIGLIDQIDDLVKVSGNPEVIRDYISQVRSILMDLTRG